MVLNIILNHIDFNDIFSKVIVLDIRNLSVFIFLLHQITQVIRLHFLDDLDQPIIKSSRHIRLMTVFFLKTTKLIDVSAVLVYNRVAHLQNIHYIVIYRIFLVLRQIG